MLFSRFLTLATAGVGTIVSARVVTYKWTVDWVTAAPDGFSRSVIGINGQWPCPTIEASVGDTVVVELTNNLGNQTTGIHFHGINQVSTNFMDGPSMVTQCPLPPGSTMKYQFEVSALFSYILLFSFHILILGLCRLTLAVHIGTTPTTWGNIRTACAAP